MIIFTVFFIVLLSALLSMMEASITTSRISRLDSEKWKGHANQASAMQILNSTLKYTSALQMGILLANVVLGVYSGLELAPKLLPYFSNIAFLQPIAWSFTLVVLTILVTTILITLGELVPKSMVYQDSESWLLKFAPSIHVTAVLAAPFAFVYNAFVKLFLRILGKNQPDQQAISEDELIHMIDQANQQGVIEEQENEIIQNIMRFADRDAYTIMTHRNEIVWIDINAPMSEISSVVKESGFTKYLVCDKDLDNILGVLRLRDFIENERKTKADIRKLLTKPAYVPESTDALKVLELFKRKRNYFTIVVDEFGSTQGIITLHDLTENIFGTLPDMDDVEEQNIVTRADGSMLVDGQIPVDELIDIVEVSDFSSESNNYSTLAGFILSKIDDIPVPGQIIEFEGYQFEIVDMDKSKIDKVLITKS